MHHSVLHYGQRGVCRSPCEPNSTQLCDLVLAPPAICYVLQVTYTLCHIICNGSGYLDRVLHNRTRANQCIASHVMHHPLHQVQSLQKQHSSKHTNPHNLHTPHTTQYTHHSHHTCHSHPQHSHHTPLHAGSQPDSSLCNPSLNYTDLSSFRAREHLHQHTVQVTRLFHSFLSASVNAYSSRYTTPVQFYYLHLKQESQRTINVNVGRANINNHFPVDAIRTLK